MSPCTQGAHVHRNFLIGGSRKFACNWYIDLVVGGSLDGLDSARFNHQATPEGISGLRLELGVKVFLASQQRDGPAEEAEHEMVSEAMIALPIGSLVVPFWDRILNINHKKELLRGLWVQGRPETTEAIWAATSKKFDVFDATRGHK